MRQFQSDRRGSRFQAAAGKEGSLENASHSVVDASKTSAQAQAESVASSRPTPVAKDAVLAPGLVAALKRVSQRPEAEKRSAAKVAASGLTPKTAKTSIVDDEEDEEDEDVPDKELSEAAHAGQRPT